MERSVTENFFPGKIHQTMYLTLFNWFLGNFIGNIIVSFTFQFCKWLQYCWYSKEILLIFALFTGGKLLYFFSSSAVVRIAYQNDTPLPTGYCCYLNKRRLTVEMIIYCFLSSFTSNYSCKYFSEMTSGRPQLTM